MSKYVGSDEIVDISCEKCSLNETAQYFCVECVCLMCSTCKINHDLFLSGHVFEEGNNIPSDLYQMKCSKHTSKITKFYCLKCKEFACQACAHCEHSLCSNMVKSVHSLSKGLHDSREFKDFYRKINDADQKLSEIGVKNTSNLLQTDKHLDKTICDIEQVRDEIITKVKTLSHELCNSLRLEATYYRANTLTVDTEQASLKEVVHAIKHDLERKKMTRENCLLFKTLKEQDAENIESTVDSLDKGCCAFMHTFQPSENVEKIRSILSSTNSFGRLKPEGSQDSVREKLREKFRLFRK